MNSVKHTLVALICSLLLINSLNCTLIFANADDLSFNYLEERKLIDDPIFIGNCTNNEVSCVKVLARYDGFHELIDELNEWKKNVEDDVEDSFLWPLVRKGIVGIGAASLNFFYPLKGLETELSLAAFCHAEKEVLEPTGKTAKGIFGFFSDTLPGWFGAKKVRNPDKGLIGDLTVFLCGNGKELGRRVTITKEQKEKFMNGILKEFKSKIKKKEYQGKEIMVLTLDFKNLQYRLDFDVVGFNPHYDKPVDEYFKSGIWDKLWEYLKDL